VTTLSQPLPRPVASAGQLIRPALLSFAVTLAGALLLVASVAAGYAHLHRDSIFQGVTVHGIPVGGLDRAAAVDELRAKLPPLDAGHLTVRFADVERRVPYAAIGRDYNVGAMIDQALAIGRAGNPLQQAGEQLRLLTGGANVAPIATWSRAALERELAAVAATAERAPRDATITGTGGRYQLVPAGAGQTVDLAGGLEQAVAAVSVPIPGDATVSIGAIHLPPAVPTSAAVAALATYDNVAGQALVLGGGGVQVVLTTDMIRGWASLEPDAAGGSWSVALDEAAIRAHVVGLVASIDRQPLDATFEFSPDGVTAVPGVTGQRLDVAATSEALISALLARAGGARPTGVNMVVALTEPEVTTAAAHELAARVVKVSSWTTKFTPGENNFSGKNITIPAKLLDGTVIAPGERFSFLDAIGSFSADKGFGPGGAIIRGRTNPTGAMGGGICSASTTLFNAALRGGYEIAARTQHSYYIDRYPVGLDATVWRSGASKRDMVFVNDSEYPLWIRGIGKKRQVTFEIWSVPDGRQVELSKARVANRTKPDDTVEYTTKLEPGQRKRVEHPVAGFQAWVTRVVRDAGGNVLHDDTFYSRYITITGIIQVGIAPGETPPDESPDDPDEARAGDG